MENLDVLPCSFRIDDFQTNMAKARRGYHSPDEFVNMLSSRRNRLRTWLNKNYDFTIVDCPPSLPMQIKFFLVTGEYFIVPSVPDRLSVRGSLYLLDRLKKLGITRLEPLGLLWSLYRKQNAMHGRIIEHVADGIQPYDRLPKPFETVIPNSAAIADSTEPEHSPTSFTVKYTPKFAKLYQDFCHELIQRTQWSSPPVPVTGSEVTISE
jgi:chromosome partitioning protein